MCSAPNRGAVEIRRSENASAVRRLAAVITDRVGAVDSDEAAAVQTEIETVIAKWETLAEQQPKLVFSDGKNPERALLVEAGEEGVALNQFATLRSMRDVDLTSELKLVG